MLGTPAAFILAMLTLQLFARHTGGGNETSAIATLRNLTSAQSQFQAWGGADVDDDGVGEFGLFQELSGAVGVRVTPEGRFAGTSPMNPPVLSGAFRTVDGLGRVRRSGYFYQVFLVAPGGGTLTERRAGTVGFLRTSVDTDAAETTWCAYAWPTKHGRSGNRTFFVNEVGDIFGTDDPRYSGAVGPLPGAAFTSGGLLAVDGTAVVAPAGGPGQDGNVWKQVN